MRELGKLTSWDDARGFGFITPLRGKQRVFVHISALPKGRRPTGEEMLSYVLGADEQGRPRALQVEFLVSAGEPGLFRWIPATCVALGTAVTFLVLVLVGCFVRQLPLYFPAIYLGLSLFLFGQYVEDKKAALANRWRIPENRLHLLSFLGGWPGALVAQQGLRHKSQKTAFLIPFWITVVLNVLVLGIFLIGLSG